MIISATRDLRDAIRDGGDVFAGAVARCDYFQLRAALDNLTATQRALLAEHANATGATGMVARGFRAAAA